MLINKSSLDRRSLLKYGAAAGMASAIGPAAFAQGAYPSRNFNILIATGQGGGAETTSRAQVQVLREYLGVDFEFEFHPGAGGQVGYEIYANRRDKDGYNIMYSNMHPEIITFAVQDTNYDLPGDITHFAKANGSPIVIYVGADSPLQTIEDLVELAQSRTVTMATSRLPHPGSIGVLALGEELGLDFNLIPFGGGNPTSMAAITGETDAAVLTAGVALSLGEQVRILGHFRNMPSLAGQLTAPLINDALGTNIPELELSSGWAVHTEVWENMPEFREVFESAVIRSFEDPKLRESFEAVNYPWDTVEYGDYEECQQIVRDTIELAQRYRELLQEA